MAICFGAARQLICLRPSDRAKTFSQYEEVLPLTQAVGRTVKNDIRCPYDVPVFASSAIDGYAVSAHRDLLGTSPSYQVRLVGSVRPGDAPLVVDDDLQNGMAACVEISTGAPFPIARGTGIAMDACIPCDRGTKIMGMNGNAFIQCSVNPMTAFNKRLVGGDFRKGDLIVGRGAAMAPKDVMTLAAIGISVVAVNNIVRAGVLSTGSELMPLEAMTDPSLAQHKIPDANGPYLAAALRELGVEATFLGTIPSDPEQLGAILKMHTQQAYYDLIITTGGVPSGRLDYVNKAVNMLQARVHFHQVAMRPGHVSLFATLYPDAIQSPSVHAYSHEMLGLPTPPQANGRGARQPGPLAMFAFPGNPVSSAVCFRFLVSPFIRELSSKQEERVMAAKVVVTEEQARRDSDVGAGAKPWIIEGSPHVEIFRHAMIKTENTESVVHVIKEQGPLKVNPFASANCWVHVTRGKAGVRAGDMAEVYPLCSPRS